MKMEGKYWSHLFKWFGLGRDERDASPSISDEEWYEMRNRRIEDALQLCPHIVLCYPDPCGCVRGPSGHVDFPCRPHAVGPQL